MASPARFYMRKLRGAGRDLHYTLSQYCNDWITVRESNIVLNPLSIEFDDEAERDSFIDVDVHGHTGFFWRLYEVDSNRPLRLCRRSAT